MARKPKDLDPLQRDSLKFLRCPKNHLLPNRTVNGECTPLWCAVETLATKAEAEPNSAALAITPEKSEENRIERAKTRLASRMSLQGLPEGLKGAAAEEWADAKLVELLPKAVAELGYKLEYGDDAERERAAKLVMDATGRGKRESGSSGQGPIVMLVGGAGGIQVPWAQRVPSGKPKWVVDGENGVTVGASADETVGKKP